SPRAWPSSEMGLQRICRSSRSRRRRTESKSAQGRHEISLRADSISQRSCRKRARPSVATAEGTTARPVRQFHRAPSNGSSRSRTEWSASSLDGLLLPTGLRSSTLREHLHDFDEGTGSSTNNEVTRLEHDVACLRALLR